MRNGITITLSQDVPADGDVAAVEESLLTEAAELTSYLLAQPGRDLLEEPAPYKTGFDGEYRLMRDLEKQPQYTEVRVRARVGEVE